MRRHWPHAHAADCVAICLNWTNGTDSSGKLYAILVDVYACLFSTCSCFLLFFSFVTIHDVLRTSLLCRSHFPWLSCRFEDTNRSGCFCDHSSHESDLLAAFGVGTSSWRASALPTIIRGGNSSRHGRWRLFLHACHERKNMERDVISL